jgi:hypothetical protein
VPFPRKKPFSPDPVCLASGDTGTIEDHVKNGNTPFRYYEEEESEFTMAAPKIIEFGVRRLPHYPLVTFALGSEVGIPVFWLLTPDLTDF